MEIRNRSAARVFIPMGRWRTTLRRNLGCCRWLATAGDGRAGVWAHGWNRSRPRLAGLYCRYTPSQSVLGCLVEGWRVVGVADFDEPDSSALVGWVPAGWTPSRRRRRAPRRRWLHRPLTWDG